MDWLHGVLGALVTEHGIDGFRFDGGDFYSYLPTDLTPTCPPTRPASARPGPGSDLPTRSTSTGPAESWAANHWPSGCTTSHRPRGRRTGITHPRGLRPRTDRARLHLPRHDGGGELDVFRTVGVDPELFVRYAQSAALFPMMQFSVSPARVLEERHLAATRDAVRLHERLGA